jgi:hypothetical protein
MAKPNYQHQKKLRELAKKKDKEGKLQRRRERSSQKGPVTPAEPAS